MLKKTYSPLSTILSSSATRRISRTVGGSAHTTTTGTHQKKNGELATFPQKNVFSCTHCYTIRNTGKQKDGATDEGWNTVKDIFKSEL